MVPESVTIFILMGPAAGLAFRTEAWVFIAALLMRGLPPVRSGGGGGGGLVDEVEFLGTKFLSQLHTASKRKTQKMEKIRIFFILGN
jgi:hypothetical protein